MAVVSVNGSKCFSFGPSDLTFLWEDCQRCFYRQVVLGVRRPRIPMAKIHLPNHREVRSSCRAVTKCR